MKTAVGTRAARRSAELGARDSSSGSEVDRPSAGFVEAVAALFETDAADLLAEMGYGYEDLHDEAGEDTSAASAGRRERK
jgi:hypothetical protein